MHVRNALWHLPVLLKGRPWHGRECYRPFFIVGSGRCGTTLMRAVLQAHPELNIPPETYTMCAAIRDYRRYGRLPWSVLLRIVLGQLEHHRDWNAFELTLGEVYRGALNWPRRDRNLATLLDAVYRAHAVRHKPTAVRWGDKTPHTTECLFDLHRVFPDLSVIHMVRDGRDVVSSFLRLEQLDLASASEHWVRRVQSSRAFGGRHPGQYLEVRYERFVSDASAVIKEVAAFLDLTFDDRMLRHHESGMRLGDVELLPHLQGAREPIHGQAVGRWRSALTAAEVAELELLMGPTLEKLGYQLTRGASGTSGRTPA